MATTKKIIVEYIWLGGDCELRSKARVLSFDVNCTVKKDIIPLWNFDGSSTGQADGHDSEVIIKPQRICKCPFRRNGDNLLVICDTHNSKNEPLATNTRFTANAKFESNLNEEPWFGIEQEFFMINAKTGLPLGFNNEIKNNPTKQGDFYCSVGACNAFGRHIIEDAIDNMLYADLDVSGINAEVAPGQWEYQIGPCIGIDSGDQLWLSRYILERTAEKYNVKIEYHPKPLGENTDFNGSGCHTNYSTKKMRDDNGIVEIFNAIAKLEPKHAEHMQIYGKDNEMRMSGKHETASFTKFTYGVADRGASVRIGHTVFYDKKGYMEDRRPASNADPYLVTSKIFETTCL